MVSPAMWRSYRATACLALVSLAIWMIGKSVGQPVPWILGVALWAVSTAFSVSLYFTMHFLGPLFDIPLVWQARKARPSRVPTIVSDICQRLELPSPRRYLVLNTEKPTAFVTQGRALVVSRSVDRMQFTPEGQAIIAHEIAHLGQISSSRHLLILASLFLPLIFVFPLNVYLDSSSHVLGLLLGLNWLTLTLPAYLRWREAAADSIASKCVGAKAMASALTYIAVCGTQWKIDYESLTHPSLQWRIERQGKLVF